MISAPWTRTATASPAGTTPPPISATCTSRDEILAARLLTTHNLYLYHALMAGIRAALAEDRFPEYRRAFWPRYREEDEARARAAVSVMRVLLLGRISSRSTRMSRSKRPGGTAHQP